MLRRKIKKILGNVSVGTLDKIMTAVHEERPPAAGTSAYDMVAASAIAEVQTTDTLMQMLAATILATLIEEEGGGRANITYSPMSMDYMTKFYDFTSERDGLITTVRISEKPDRDMDRDKWLEPSNRHGIASMIAEQVGDVGMPSIPKPQAATKEYDRPIWAISYPDREGNRYFAKMADRKDAEAHLDDYATVGLVPPEVQNRFCLHTNCPSQKCTEVASEAT